MPSKSSANAKTEETTALAIAPNDELAAAGLGDIDCETDGLEEIGREDIRISARVFNMRGTDANGDPIPKNVFFDTVDETTSKRVDAVLLSLHKTNLYSYFDNDKDETVKVCSSYDRVTGTMRETGETRPCKGCPDSQWTRKDGKPKRNCGEVYNVAGIDRETQMPFMIRFRRTSLEPIKSYLQKHHIGRRVMSVKDPETGKTKIVRRNYPLFAFKCELTLKMDDSGKYALPVLNRGEVLAPEEFESYKDASEQFRENMRELVDRADDQASAREGSDDNGEAAGNAAAAKAGAMKGGDL